MLEFGQIESFYPESYRAFKKNILREYLQYKILEILWAETFMMRFSYLAERVPTSAICGQKRISTIKLI